MVRQTTLIVTPFFTVILISQASLLADVPEAVLTLLRQDLSAGMHASDPTVTDDKVAQEFGAFEKAAADGPATLRSALLSRLLS